MSRPRRWSSRPRRTDIALNVDDFAAARAALEDMGVSFAGDTFGTGVCPHGVAQRVAAGGGTQSLEDAPLGATRTLTLVVPAQEARRSTLAPAGEIGAAPVTCTE